MKIFKSIKWRLQLWYGLILVAVLAGFGFTAYQLERARQMRRVDEDLQHAVGGFMNALQKSFWGKLNPDGEPIPDRPPPLEQQPPDHPFNDRAPDGPRPPAEFNLRPWDALLVRDDTNRFYCVLWSRDGNELNRSTNAPVNLSMPARGNPRGPQPARMRGTFREIFQPTPRSEMILVGRSVATELTELHLTALRLTAAGGVILFFGLAGGWWFVGRALQPISAISATAAKISTGDLSQRINAADTESELGQLAGVLNSTFEKLEASFAQQAQFTSDAAHELRTPVSVILTQAQSALNRERSPAEYRETLEACERAAQRMKRLTTSLLQLARFDAGQETLRQEKFSLAATAQNCAELVRPIAVEKNVTIETELAEANCIGDSDRVAQVITNLLTNAIKYNKDGGKITVTTRMDNGTAILTVTDSGLGISAEDLPHVFKRFYRADKSRTSSSGNAGLGLAICKAIIEAHGGTIEAASEPGVGTTFTVHLNT